jgi:ketosteroid isomerase-like protein
MAQRSIQTGPIGDNLPASINSFRLRGASILTFRDGKRASVTDYYDMATFLTQLGGTT